LLIASPNPDQLVSSYGHSLLRVKDPKLNIDYVFNYGTFDRTLSGFETFMGIATGKLKYEIWVIPYTEYYETTLKENRKLVEYTFNFSAEEKNTIWHNLISIVKNKNQYLFDFFSQNCTTFVRDLITYNLGKQILLPSDLGQKTYHDINIKYTKNKLWYVFLVDLISGMNLDKKAPSYESLYEPKELVNAWSKSFILEDNGEKKPIFASASLLINGKNLINETKTPFIISPLFFSLVLLVLVLSLSIIEWETGNYYRWFDILIFGFTGFLGLLFYLFKFACPRWYFLMDWKMFWLHPFHLLAVFFLIKSLNKPLKIYHYINSAILAFLIVGVFFLPQHFNPAIILLIICLFIRSIFFVLRERIPNKKKTIRKLFILKSSSHNQSSVKLLKSKEFLENIKFPLLSNKTAFCFNMSFVSNSTNFLSYKRAKIDFLSGVI